MSEPSPPDGLPRYLADGIPKQSDSTLEEIRDWIEDLLAHRGEVDFEDVSAEEGEEIEDVTTSDRGTVVVKKVSCGKDGCKCQRGELHGPYKYLVRRTGESLTWEYLGAAAE